ncbi:MAG: GNAT family N-acetyltransferase [Bacilli bacterium]
MKIAFATESDYEYIREHDRHLIATLILKKIESREIYILRDQDDENIGWLRWGYFWDSVPFMNLIWIDGRYRGRGLGKRTVLQWEAEMKQQGFESVMTSAQSDEDSQRFYRKLGYRDAGCLVLETQPLEIILMKSLLR